MGVMMQTISDVISHLQMLKDRIGDVEVQALHANADWYEIKSIGYDKYEMDGPWIVELEIELLPDDK